MDEGLKTVVVIVQNKGDLLSCKVALWLALFGVFLEVIPGY